MSGYKLHKAQLVVYVRKNGSRSSPYWLLYGDILKGEKVLGDGYLYLAADTPEGLSWSEKNGSFYPECCLFANLGWSEESYLVDRLSP